MDLAMRGRGGARRGRLQVREGHARALQQARTIHPSLAEMSGEFMARNRSGLPFHPGAERYYREKGLIK